MVAGAEPQRFGIILELQDGGSFEQQNPLAVVLIVPEGWRRGVALGDDAFHPHRSGLKQILEIFLIQILRNISQHVDIHQ